jgi:hypothetical protein
MHPKDRQPFSFDDPVANGTAAPWRSGAFATQDVDELIHHLNTQSHHKVTKITPLERGGPFSFTRSSSFQHGDAEQGHQDRAAGQQSSLYLPPGGD